MATVKIILDHAHLTKDGLCPVRLRFGANKLKADVTLNVLANEKDWDKKNSLLLSTEPKFKIKNKIIQTSFDDAERFIVELELKGRFINDAKKLRDMFTEKDKSIMFLDKLMEFADKKADGSRGIYIGTYNKLKEYSKRDIYFEDITPSWLGYFDAWCAKHNLMINTRGIHFRNIRAIFNDAIDDRLISADIYPFRKFKIKTEETAKRTLTIDEFKKIMAYNGSMEENWARDVFLLSFYLLGINMKDLFNLETIVNGEITFRRYKTHKIFNVLLEPEAIQLIEKYKGKKLLLNFADTQNKRHSFKMIHHQSFNRKVNKYLSRIIANINKEEEEKDSDFRMREFTTYAARHSWATFAGELDVEEKTISMALGHESQGNSTTKIYIQFNHKKVNQANRDVIDYVLKKDS